MTTESTTQAPGAMAMPALAVMSVDAVQACTEACGGWQQEIAHFIDLRLAHNRETWDALMTARDIAGVVRAQQQWGSRRRPITRARPPASPSCSAPFH